MFGRERHSSEQHGTATQGLSALIAGPTAALSRDQQGRSKRRTPSTVVAVAHEIQQWVADFGRRLVAAQSSH